MSDCEELVGVLLTGVDGAGKPSCLSVRVVVITAKPIKAVPGCDTGSVLHSKPSMVSRRVNYVKQVMAKSICPVPERV